MDPAGAKLWSAGAIVSEGPHPELRICEARSPICSSASQCGDSLARSPRVAISHTSTIGTLLHRRQEALRAKAPKKRKLN
eukprot:6486133-Amphidinium_carterae.1